MQALFGRRGRRLPEAVSSSRSTCSRRMMGLRGGTFQSVKRTIRAQRLEGATTSAEWFFSRPGRDASARFRTGAFQCVGCQAKMLVLWSKTSPDFSIACMMTASLRATATAARLKPIFSLSFSPHVRSVLSAFKRASGSRLLLHRAIPSDEGRRVVRYGRHSRPRRIGSGEWSDPATRRPTVTF